MLGSGVSILVLIHVYLVLLLTTHGVYATGRWAVSVLCIDVSKARVHMHLMVLSLGMRSVIYMELKSRGP